MTNVPNISSSDDHSGEEVGDTPLWCRSAPVLDLFNIQPS